MPLPSRKHKGNDLAASATSMRKESVLEGTAQFVCCCNRSSLCGHYLTTHCNISHSILARSGLPTSSQIPVAPSDGHD
jgi:hypothetical protein